MAPLAADIRAATISSTAAQEARNAEAVADLAARQDALRASAETAHATTSDGGPAVAGGHAEERGQKGGTEDPEESKGHAGTAEYGRKTGSADHEKSAPGPATNKSLTPDNENKAGGLDGVAFASAAAEAAAVEAGLDANAFKRRRKSSANGFTVADVQKIAGEA